MELVFRARGLDEMTQRVGVLGLNCAVFLTLRRI